MCPRESRVPPLRFSAGANRNSLSSIERVYRFSICLGPPVPSSSCLVCSPGGSEGRRTERPPHTSPFPTPLGRQLNWVKISTTTSKEASGFPTYARRRARRRHRRAARPPEPVLSFVPRAKSQATRRRDPVQPAKPRCVPRHRQRLAPGRMVGQPPAGFEKIRVLAKSIFGHHEAGLRAPGANIIGPKKPAANPARPKLNT